MTSDERQHVMNVAKEAIRRAATKAAVFSVATSAGVQFTENAVGNTITLTGTPEQFIAMMERYANR